MPGYDQYYSALNTMGTYEDIDLCVDLEAIKADAQGNSFAGLIFWAIDYDNYYYLVVTAEQSIGVFRRQRGRVLPQLRWTSFDALKPGNGVVNELRVVTMRQHGLDLRQRQVLRDDEGPAACRRPADRRPRHLAAERPGDLGLRRRQDHRPRGAGDAIAAVAAAGATLARRRGCDAGGDRRRAHTIAGDGRKPAADPGAEDGPGAIEITAMTMWMWINGVAASGAGRGRRAPPTGSSGCSPASMPGRGGRSRSRWRCRPFGQDGEGRRRGDRTTRWPSSGGSSSCRRTEERNVRRLFDLAKRDVAGYETYAARIARLSTQMTARGSRTWSTACSPSPRPTARCTSARSPISAASPQIFGIDEAGFERIAARHVIPADGDPYAILGIDRSLSIAEIRVRYRALAAENHPDRLIARGMPPEAAAIAHQRMAAINLAWQRIQLERG